MAELIDLALAQFPDLKPAEHKVVEAATTGRLQVVGDPKDYEQGIAGAANWGDDHVVRAEFLRWLFTNGDARSKCDSRGITVYYGRVDGELDLKFMTLDFPLSFYECVFDARLDVEQLELPALSLSGCQLDLLWAVRLKCNGDLRLDNGFQSANTVYLGSSDIAGDLRMNGAIIKAEDIAVAAAGSRVHGNVQLGQGYEAKGLTGFAAVEIGGDVNLTAGKFNAVRDSDKRAVSFTGARIGGSVLAQAKTEIHGTTDFLGAAVSGDFDFGGCKLSVGSSRVDLQACKLEYSIVSPK